MTSLIKRLARWVLRKELADLKKALIEAENSATYWYFRVIGRKDGI